MATFWDFVACLGFSAQFGFLLLVFCRPSDSASSPSPRSAPSIGSSQMGCSFCGWVVVSADGFLIWVLVSADGLFLHNGAVVKGS
jgi:hypothetical protein